MHSLEIRKCVEEKAAGRKLANFSGFPFGLGKKREWEKKNTVFCIGLQNPSLWHQMGGPLLGQLHNKLFSNSLTSTGCPTIQFWHYLPGLSTDAEG